MQQRRKNQRGSAISNNVEQTLNTFGNMNTKEYHQEQENAPSAYTGKQLLNQNSKNYGFSQQCNEYYEEFGISLTANQKFQTHLFVQQKHLQIISQHSEIIEFIFMILPCFISQTINNEIGFENTNEMIVGQFLWMISFINLIFHIYYFFCFIFKDDMILIFFSSINQIKKRQEQLINVAIAKQEKQSHNNQEISIPLSQIKNISVFPFPNRIELTTKEKIHQLANCNEKSLQDIISIYINIPGKNYTFDDILSDLNYIFKCAVNVTSVKLLLSQKQYFKQLSQIRKEKSIIK